MLVSLRSLASIMEADPAVPGGVQVVLDSDLPTGTFRAWVKASGPDVNVDYLFRLSVAPGDPVEVTLDYTESRSARRTSVSVTDATVPLGGRVTLTAPSGVDLREHRLRAYLSGEALPTDFLTFTADRLNPEASGDGSSLTFTVPTTWTARGGDSPMTLPLPPARPSG